MAAILLQSFIDVLKILIHLVLHVVVFLNWQITGVPYYILKDNKVNSINT